jgi:hypothetical protein
VAPLEIGGDVDTLVGVAIGLIAELAVHHRLAVPAHGGELVLQTSAAPIQDAYPARRLGPPRLAVLLEHEGTDFRCVAEQWVVDIAAEVGVNGDRGGTAVGIA